MEATKVLSHEIITNELRKLRNDMLFLKANLFYPEDIDHGPTEEMISVDGITIPDYVNHNHFLGRTMVNVFRIK